MDIKLGQVYFYQSLQFAMTGFLRPFSRIHTQYNGVDNYRVGVANFFNLHDAIDTPLYENDSPALLIKLNLDAASLASLTASVATLIASSVPVESVVSIVSSTSVPSVGAL